jgi:hypothetical protein
MNLSRVLTAILAVAPLAAAQPDYFPLHVGNQWIYRQSGQISGAPVVVSIPRTVTFAERTYSMVSGFAEGPLYLRMEDDGTLYAYDTESRTEGVWAAFATPEGQNYRTIVNPCNGLGLVKSRNAKLTVPMGELSGALEVDYPAGNCADAGLTADYFVPYIGLVARESITIAGPHSLRLSYARVGGVTVVSEPEVTFSVTIDRSRYGGEGVPVMTARVTLRATQSQPLELTFPSGQRFDLELKDSTGKPVYRWSADKVFPLIFGTEQFGPGERNWVVQVPLSASGQRLPAGSYTAEAWLATAAPRSYAASVGFEILPPQ